MLARAPQEASICYQEGLLGLPRLSLIVVLDAIYRNSAEQILTRHQLNTLALELSLDMTDLDTVDSKQFRLFKHFKTAKGSVDVYKFTVLAVLLCTGTVIEKAQALFERCPWVSEGTLGEEGLRKMMGLMCEIASEAIPRLAESDAPVEGQTLPVEEVSAYVSRLKEAVPRIIGRICAEMMLVSKSLSMQDFTNAVVQNKDVQPITTASDIRTLLFIDSVTTAALLPHSAANPS